jgi:hypothetical protein
MTAIEHSIDVDVPISGALVPGPELAELTGAVARAVPQPPGAMHIELAFDADGADGFVPRLAIAWGRAPHEQGRVTFSSRIQGTRVEVSVAWPDTAGDDVGALYARAKLVSALERYRRALERALEPLAASAST